MPNRIIKESICTSEEINQLSAEAENFFYRLMVNCDDYGRFHARRGILLGRLYPLRFQMDAKKIDELLIELIAANLIFIYYVNEIAYLQVCTWAEHQTIRNKRSKFPDPEEAGHYIIDLDSYENLKAIDFNCEQVNTLDDICRQLFLGSNFEKSGQNGSKKGQGQKNILSEPEIKKKSVKNQVNDDGENSESEEYTDLYEKQGVEANKNTMLPLVSSNSNHVLSGNNNLKAIDFNCKQLSPYSYSYSKSYSYSNRSNEFDPSLEKMGQGQNLLYMNNIQTKSETGIASEGEQVTFPLHGKSGDETKVLDDNLVKTADEGLGNLDEAELSASPAEGEDLLLLDDEEEGVASEGSGKSLALKKKAKSKSKNSSEDDKLFDRFWEAYPRKVKKKDSRKVFERLKVDEKLLGEILSDISWRLENGQWQERQYIPHPTTYLRGRRFEDERESWTVGQGKSINWLEGEDEVCEVLYDIP